MKTIITSMAFLLICNLASAHAIWIETKSTETLGNKHEAKVYLGEYAAGERDSIKHWFSDMAQFKLWLITPDGKKTELKTEEKGNYFSAYFTPEGEGTYYLMIDHGVAQVYGTNKIYYHAQAVVNVGNSMKGIGNSAIGNLAYMIYDVKKTYTVGKTFALQLKYAKLPTNSQVNVQSPEGWSKTFDASSDGSMTFAPVWEGLYLLEGTFTEDVIGKQGEQEYTSVWHCVTSCVEVN